MEKSHINIILSGKKKKTDTKEHILYDSIYVNFKDRKNQQIVTEIRRGYNRDQRMCDIC